MSRFFGQWLANDRWIPALFILFFVGLVTIQGRFVYIAFTTFPGTITDRPFERGQRFNEVLAEADAQRRLGWQVAASFDAVAGVGAPFVVSALDKDGAPLVGATVTVLAERFTRHAQALRLPLVDRGDGRHDAAVTLPLGGRWTFTVEVRQGSAIHRDRLERSIAARGSS